MVPFFSKLTNSVINRHKPHFPSVDTSDTPKSTPPLLQSAPIRATQHLQSTPFRVTQHLQSTPFRVTQHYSREAFVPTRISSHPSLVHIINRKMVPFCQKIDSSLCNTFHHGNKCIFLRSPDRGIGNVLKLKCPTQNLLMVKALNTSFSNSILFSKAYLLPIGIGFTLGLISLDASSYFNLLINPPFPGFPVLVDDINPVPVLDPLCHVSNTSSVVSDTSSAVSDISKGVSGISTVAPETFFVSSDSSDDIVLDKKEQKDVSILLGSLLLAYLLIKVASNI